MSRRRVGVALLVAAVFAGGLAGCTLKMAKAGARCTKVGDYAQDGRHVLKCNSRRRWERGITVAQADASFAALQQYLASQTTTTQPPPPPPAPTPPPPANRAPQMSDVVASTFSGTAPLTVGFGWTVTDPDGDRLACDLDLDGSPGYEQTIEPCSSYVARTVTYTTPGVRGVVIRVRDPGGLADGATAMISVGSGGPAFTIQTRAPGLSVAQASALASAVARWQSVVRQGATPIGLTLPNADFSCSTGVAPYSATVDLLVDVEIGPIDGPSSILADAEACLIRQTELLPAYSKIRIDSADVAAMEAGGHLSTVLTHELGHALGFGVLWDEPELSYVDRSGSPSRFGGAAANGIWQQLGGSGRMLLQGGIGLGSDDSHWSEGVFGAEVMTAVRNNGANPLSALTVASMADLGYGVDIAAADAYTWPPPPSFRDGPAQSAATLGFTRARGPGGRI